MRQHAAERDLGGDRLHSSNDTLPPSRRSVLRAAGAGLAVLGGGALLSACSSAQSGPGQGSSGVVLSGRDIVIGFIHPLSGPLAAYSAADSWIIDAIRATPQFQAGFTVGGKNYPVTIRSYDTRSDAARAGQLASQAITADKVDLIVTAGTTQTVTPVTAAAEKLGTPAIGAAGPWQAWYAGLGGNPATGQSTFKPAWVKLYGPGTSNLAQTFVPMWNKVHGQVSSDLTVAGLFPADADGDALRAAWPAFTGPARYTMVDPVAGPAGRGPFGPLIGTFKARHCDLFTNAQTPQDFSAFWKQAAAQGYQPKLATVTGGLQFPSEVTALGPLARNVALAAWWAPNMPRTSSLTGQTGAQLAAAFTAETGSPWVQSLSNYSLFEVAHAALTAVNDPHDKAEVAQALGLVDVSAIAGTLNWATGSAAPGVVNTRCAGAQWQQNAKGRWSLAVVDNTFTPEVPLTGTLRPTNK